MGGLGLRAAKEHVSAAYTTSYISSQPLVKKIIGTAGRAGDGDQMEEEEEVVAPAGEGNEQDER